ncbi:hypothetical protein ACFRCI_44905 [Streptomyces sp. NPDC056638]
MPDDAPVHIGVAGDRATSTAIGTSSSWTRIR